jgi:hypothetical protein
MWRASFACAHTMFEPCRSMKVFPLISRRFFLLQETSANDDKKKGVLAALRLFFLFRLPPLKTERIPMSKSYESTIQELRKKLDEAIGKYPKCSPAFQNTPSPFSAFWTVEEEIILQMSRMAILLYRMGKMGAYSHVLNARNFLICEADNEKSMSGGKAC